MSSEIRKSFAVNYKVPLIVMAVLNEPRTQAPTTQVVELEETVNVVT